MKQEQLIEKARKEITDLGWRIEEYNNGRGECHLVFTKGGERKGWGLLPTLYCWTEAYETLTGKSWTDLIKEDS